MNIQPISYTNMQVRNNNKMPKAQAQTFQGEYKRDDAKLQNALKALAISSAIALTPAAMTSCDKEIDGWCDHPNHWMPDVNDSTANKPDTIYKGKLYELPSVSMPRYKVEGNDTTYFGTVNFSEGVVHVPYNAHKSSELKTVLKFLDAMGLESKNIDKEYTPTRAFAYNHVPAQIAWLNEKTGTVNQLVLDGYDNNKNTTKMKLISIPESNEPVERQLELTPAGTGKLLVTIFDKKGENEITKQLFTLEDGVVTQFNKNDKGHFERVLRLSKGENGTSVKTEGNGGEKSKFASIKVMTAISEEK